MIRVFVRPVLRSLMFSGVFLYTFSCAVNSQLLAKDAAKDLPPHVKQVLAKQSPALAPLGADGDLAPKVLDAKGLQYERRSLGDKRFDGAADDNWTRHSENICRDDRLRPIILDVDKTAIKGNFLNKVQVLEEARLVINNLDTRYGVIFLSANFAVDRMAEFFKRYDYPSDAPLFARPRNYWQANYDQWCHLDQRYAVCESANKSAVIQSLKQRCAHNAPVMVGVGDKFSDYLAYRQAGLCPIIVPNGHVAEVNKKELQDGCVLKEGADYAWRDDGKGAIERCAVVPERYILSWDKIGENMDALLSGQVQCGVWSK